MALSSDITIESAGWRGKGVKADGPNRAVRPGDEGEQTVRELVRTNDIVLVSAVGALLDGANIHHLVLDQNMSIIEGSLGVLPRRILVHEDDNRKARQLLRDAGLAHELRPDE
jgi:Putative prokaryotic signal transducing protein